jgi:hypothetical protein
VRGARRSFSVAILSCDAVLVVTNLRNSRLGFEFHLRFTFQLWQFGWGLVCVEEGEGLGNCELWSFQVSRGAGFRMWRDVAGWYGDGGELL